MKNTLTLIFAALSFTAYSQIQDLPVGASSSSVYAGQSTFVTTTGSQTGINYTLRNSSNATVYGPTPGTGGDMYLNTGALNSAETFNVYAEPGNQNCIALNGVDESINCGNSFRGITANGVTVSAWINTSASGANQMIVTKYTGSAGFLLYVDPNGKASFDGRVVGNLTYRSSGPSTTSVNDGQWHHVVGITNGITWIVYVDGVVESATSQGPTANVGTGADLLIGTYYNGTGYFNGLIDDVSIWNTYGYDNSSVLPAIYAGCQDGSEANLTGLFQFDDGGVNFTDASVTGMNGNGNAVYSAQGITACTTAGQTPIQMTQTTTIGVVAVNDETVSGATSVCSGSSSTITTGGSGVGADYFLLDGNGTTIDGPIAGTGSGLSFNTGPITATTTFSVQGNVGSNQATNTALALDGNNDYINLTADHRGLTGEVTVGCWMRSSQPNGALRFLITKYDQVFNGGYLLYIDANGKARFDCRGASGGTYMSSGSSTTSVNDGQWHYVVATLKVGGNAKVYVDGVLESTSTVLVDGGLIGNFDPLIVGAFINTAPGNNNTGFAEVDVDQVEIWSAELNAASILSNMTNCLTGTETGLTGYFDLNEQGGGIATDLSATGIDGTLSGADLSSAWISGAPTNCSVFDGCGLTMTQQVTVSVDNVAPVADVVNLPNVTGQCQITSLTAPTATDACSGPINGTHNASFPITSNTTITWTYDDGDGNTSTQTQDVVLNDNTDPVPDNGTLADVTAQCSVTSLTNPTATDNCSGAISGTHNATFPITSNTTVTWSYDDGNGNIATQTQNVVINDNVAPVADAASLSDIVEQCSVTSLANPSATDNCSAVTITNNASLPITANTTITWTYTDVAGNSSTQTQNVIVNDNIAPVADAATLPDVVSQCPLFSLQNPSATDNCSPVLVMTTTLLPITATTTITWTYTDNSGNTSTQTQNIIVNDNTAPVEDVATLPDLTAACEITSLTPPTATDNCAGAITGTTTTVLPINASTVVTWTYDDGNGNIATQTQNVVINDALAPVEDQATLPDLTAACEITSLTPPTATDNCAGAITGTTTASLPITVSGAITWTYDDGNGNISTQTQNVLINDNVDPVPDAATLADITETCEVTSLVPPTATDNCLGAITGTHNATFPITASTLVTWTYTDGNANSVTQTQQVNITDNVAPVPDIATLADVVETCEVTSLTDPTATDNCAATVSVSSDASFPITSNTTVTWTYDDGNGNTSTQTQDVVINPVDASVSVSGFVITANESNADAYQWVDCDNGNAPIAGETNASFTATVNGSYACIVTIGNCDELSDCTSFTTIGFEEITKDLVTIYPNPTAGNVTIEGTAAIEEVSIHAITGELIQTVQTDNATKAQVSLEHLSHGVYTIYVRTSAGVSYQRIIRD